MDESTAALAAAVGVRVRQGRQLREWTLEQLADAAGLSRRMLINVEQGVANPSVGTLLKIGEALGMGLPSLVEPPGPTSLKITRRGDGPLLWRGNLGGRGIMVAGIESSHALELWDWTLNPGDRHDSGAHATGTKELLQVQEGCVTIEVGGHTAVLQTGDAMTFDGDVVHAYLNAGADSARFSLAVFEPRAGSRA